MAKVSVIIPIYNVEKYLKKCVTSVLEQTLIDIEVVLVDDGSPDASGEICDEFEYEDNRVKVIHKKNGGVAAARNDGFRVASGDWVIFCDSDDYLQLDALEKLYCIGEENDSDVVFGDVNRVSENGMVEAVKFYENEFTTQDSETIRKLIAADFSRGYCFDPPKEGVAFGYGGPWNKLVRRKLLVDNCVSFDARLKGIFDDILYTAYVFANAKKVTYTHTLIYNYRILSTSITKTYKANLLEINQAIFQAWDEFMDRYDEDGMLRKPYYSLVVRRFTNLFGLYFFNPENEKALNVQFEELKKVLGEQHYRDAIYGIEKNKLHGKKDGIYSKAAKLGSPLMIYILYKITTLVKG